MIITGSCVAYYHNLVNTPPKDLDLFYKESDKGVVNPIESDYHFIPDRIYDMLLEDSVEGFISADHLLTLKCSHLQWDVKWEKTKRDALIYKQKGCSIDGELYNLLVEHWKTVHGDKSFLNLNKPKEKFFQDNVKYIYDHDYLHEVVARGLGLSEPTYNKCLKTGKDVLIDKDKFDNLSFQDQVSMFRQEIAVIAYERWVVFGKKSWYQAHSLALKKTITNLTKGWASDFLIKHLEHFVKPEYDYYSELMKLK